MNAPDRTSETLAGGQQTPDKMPGHWLLAKMGKRVLRPGGMPLTRKMLNALKIQFSDAVVEFAPGLGATAQLTLQKQPQSYTAIERDEAAAAQVRSYLAGTQQRCLVGTAQATGLPDASATVVYGEAMLSMQSLQRKQQIVREASRLLQPGGRYGIHELCLIPDDIDAATRQDMQHGLAEALHHGTLPLTPAQWRELLEREGFRVQEVAIAPMHLLEPIRLIQDEGIFGALRFLWNLSRNPQARARILAMRRVLRKYQDHLAAVMVVGVKL